MTKLGTPITDNLGKRIFKRRPDGQWVHIEECDMCHVCLHRITYTVVDGMAYMNHKCPPRSNHHDCSNCERPLFYGRRLNDGFAMLNEDDG